MGYRSVFAALAVMAPLAVDAADPPDLGPPLACRLGSDCWIPRYVDIDPGPGAVDHACGGLTADDHDGTDFAIRDLAEVAAGVPVLAMAGGIVAGLRDGVDDRAVTSETRESVNGIECGNGVIVRHSDGWESQYCHMRKGSIAVADGDVVERGQQLGLVGLSGMTSFAHVHMTLRHDGEVIDPFTAHPVGTACTESGTVMFDASFGDLTYQPVMITAIGFADAVPTMAEVEQGRHRAAMLPVDAPALIVYAMAFGVRQGDSVHLVLDAPDGSRLVDNRRVQEKDQARSFVFAGKRNTRGSWPPGTYLGEIAIERDGAVYARSMAVEIE